MIIDPIKSLLYSRKFLLAVLALAQTLVLKYLHIDAEVWQGVNAVLLVLIGAIAVEDAAEKFGALGK